VEWRGTLPAALTALVFSYLGARARHGPQPAVLRPSAVVLLIAVFVYTIRRKDRQLHAPRLGHGAQILRACSPVPRSVFMTASSAGNRQFSDLRVCRHIRISFLPLAAPRSSMSFTNFA